MDPNATLRDLKVILKGKVLINIFGALQEAHQTCRERKGDLNCEQVQRDSPLVRKTEACILLTCGPFSDLPQPKAPRETNGIA